MSFVATDGIRKREDGLARQIYQQAREKAEFFPTPMASEAGKSEHTLGLVMAGTSQMTLDRYCRLFPTPRAGKTTDENEENWLLRYAEGKVSTPPLAMAARLYPTPTTSDGGREPEGSTGRKLVSEVGGHGQLNPTWVCWLMGWPFLEGWDWTSLDPCPDPQAAWDSLFDTMLGEPEGIPRTAKGIKKRKDRLKIIGNGQCPLAAFAAFRILESL